MEQEMLRQILTMVTGIKAEVTGIKTEVTDIKARLDRIEAQQAKDSEQLAAIEAQQAKDSEQLAVLVEHSRDIVERVTGHDLVFDALEEAIEYRKKVHKAS